MKKRYIALGSVVMFLLLLRNRKPEELVVEPVGPVIAHGDEDTKEVEVKMEVSNDASPVSSEGKNSAGVVGNDVGYVRPRPDVVGSSGETSSPSGMAQPALSSTGSVASSVVSSTGVASNAGGISTTSVVSTGEAIVNKLDNLLADRSDDYTRWVEDEEEKNRKRNGDVSVGFSTSSGSFE